MAEPRIPECFICRESIEKEDELVVVTDPWEGAPEIYFHPDCVEP